MKVLFQNRKKDLWVGGDYIQLEKTAKEVLKKHDIEINDQPIYLPALDYLKFDIVHMFNFSMRWTKLQLAVAALHNKPKVCSMIYHEGENFVDYKEQQIMADNLDAAIFLCQGEYERFKRHLTIDEKKVYFVPNGIEKFWFQKVEKEKVEPYILTVGRIEPHKGQLATAKACKELGIRYVMVGEDTDQKYTSDCIKEGAEWLGKKKGKALLKLYANCSAFVLASRAEIQPLSVMEAGAQAKNIVIGNGCEWKDIPNAEWCDWDDVNSIKIAIEKALKKKRNTELRNKLKEMTWDKVGEMVLKIYEDISLDKTK